MRTSHLSILIPLLLFYGTAKPQASYDILKVGGEIPQIHFNTVLNYNTNEFKTTDLVGKKVIIDFWTQWCTSCISSFPKIENLKQIFGDKVIILTVTESNINEFTSLRSKSRILQQSKLPFIIGDTVLFRMASPPFVPYAIWINEKGIIEATSLGTSITENNIRKFINGEKLNLNIERNSSSTITDNYTIKETYKTHKDISYYSSLEKENKNEYLPRYRYLRNPANGVGILNLDVSLAELFRHAYSIKDIRNVRTNTSELKYIIYPPNENKRKEWETKSFFSYTLRLEPNKYLNLPDSIYKLLLKFDLYNILGIKGTKKRIIEEVFVLKAIKGTPSLNAKNTLEDPIVESTKNGLYIRNHKSHFLVKGLENWINKYNDKFIPIADETNIEGNIDIELKFQDNKISSINKSLKKYGLQLTSEYKETECLILEKKKYP